MKRYLEDIIIAWLRSQPAFTSRTRFDLELLIGDLVCDVAGEADPPVAEQLVSSNALRQRRWRERHRNAAVTHQSNADTDGDEGDDN